MLKDIFSNYGEIYWEMPDVGTAYPFFTIQGNVSIDNAIWHGDLELNLWHNENPEEIIYNLMDEQNFKRIDGNNWIHGSIRQIGDTISIDEDITNTLIRIYFKGV